MFERLSPSNWLRRQSTRFREPGWRWVIAGLALLFAAPALWSGLATDDYRHRAALTHNDPVTPYAEPLRGLFSFTPQDAEIRRELQELGYLPWWADPDFQVSFFRPLTALTHLVEYRLWPDLYVAQHAQSLLWYVLGVVLVFGLYRRIHPGAAVAGLAGLMFAIEDAHALPVGWLANRSALLALVFGTAALLLHVRFRQEGRRLDFALALVCWTLALFGAEAGVAAGAYLFAWELCLGPGTWWRRFLALVPYGVIMVAWRLAYRALDYGARASGVYVDPLADGVTFFVTLLQRPPILMLGQWLQLPIDFAAVAADGARTVLALVGWGVSLLLLALFAGLLRQRAEARFWALGMLLSCIPASATTPMLRVLLFPGIGALALLALQIERLGWLEKTPGKPVSRLAAIAAGLLLVLHVLLAPFLLSANIWLLVPGLDGRIRQVSEAVPEEDLSQKTLIFLGGSQLLATYTHAMRHIESGEAPRRVALLAGRSAETEVTRLDERTLEIRPAAGFLEYPMDRLSRTTANPFQPGDRVSLPDYEVEILGLTADGRPAAARFTFVRRLEAPTLIWTRVEGFRLLDFSLPEVGETVRF